MALLTELCADCGKLPSKHGIDTGHPFKIFAQQERIEELGRGVIAVLHDQPDGRWAWSVRWPGPKEKDPMLAAGGFAVGSADSEEEALSAAKRAKKEREG